MVLGCRPFRLRCLRWVWYCRSKWAFDAVVAAVVMMAFPREKMHNHFLGYRGVKMQINSRDRRLGFLRVAASSNISLKRTRHKAAYRLARTFGTTKSFRALPLDYINA